MKRIAIILFVGLLLQGPAFSQPASVTDSENGPDFWASFPPANESNETLLLRFRDEIVAAAGLKGGFEELHLPADLRRERVTILGAHNGSGERHFAIAFPAPGLPAELADKPNWSQHGNSVVWTSDSCPKELIRSLMVSLPKASAGNLNRFQMLMRADWMGLPRTGDSAVVKLPGGSLGEALASIDQVEIEGSIGESVDMSMKTQFADRSQNAIVADAWRSFLLTFRGGAGGPQQVLDSLSRAQVFENGRHLEVRVPLTLTALERLQHAQASRQFLNWTQLARIMQEP